MVEPTEEPESPSLPERALPRGPRPWATWFAGAACVVASVGYLASGEDRSWEAVSRWGLLAPGAIWEGQYWGLLTCTFVHGDALHLLFNLYWLWVLGRALEQAIGPLRWLAFFTLAAFVSSSAELAVSGQTGIGASGVVYAMFGFMWLTKDRFPGFAALLTRRTVELFFAWLVLCVFLTFTHVMAIGNAAHVSGLVVGVLVAEVFVTRRWRRAAVAGLVVVVLGATAPLFWAPWSVNWVSHEAYLTHSRKDYVAAERWYRRSLEMGAPPSWVWRNLAYLYSDQGKEAEFSTAMERLRASDPKAAQEVEGELSGDRRRR